MPKFNTSPALSAQSAADQASREANLAYDDMVKKHQAAIDAIRAFNTSRETTREKFEAAGSAWRNVSSLSGDLANNTSSFPDPIPEPTSTEPVVNGEDEVTVRGRRVR